MHARGNLGNFRLNNEQGTIKALIPALTLVVTVLIFTLGKYQTWKSGEGAISKALHGDIESLEKLAYNIRGNRWVIRFLYKKTRKDIIHALCLSWSLDLPPYTRALIFDALVDISKKERGKYIQRELTRINQKFILYQDSFDSDEFNNRMRSNDLLLQKLSKYTNTDLS